jgi:hypothetical protein
MHSRSFSDFSHKHFVTYSQSVSTNTVRFSMRESCSRRSFPTVQRKTALRYGAGMATIYWRGRCASLNWVEAGKTFSLIPPTGSTLPRSVISPVMAASLCTGRRGASAVMIITPA